MPRVRKKRPGEPSGDPVTGDEIGALFRQAAARPPYPDQQTCDLLAQAINRISEWPHRTEQQLRAQARIREAVNMLLLMTDVRRIDPDDSGIRWIYPDLHSLNVALRKAYPLLGIEKNRKAQSQWAVPAVPTWCVAVGVIAELERDAGKSPNSVAVKFTTLVLHRLGHTSATYRSVSDWIKLAVTEC